MNSAQMPPHSPECERACLAAVLLRPELFDDVATALGPDPAVAFYVERHAILWKVYSELVQTGIEIDLRTLQARLEDRGDFEKVGGMAYLAGLDLDLPDLAQVGQYAATVCDRAKRRQLLSLARRMERQALGGDHGGAAAELVTSYRRQLEDLEDGAGSAAGDGLATGLADDVLRDAMERQRQREETGQPVLGIPTGISYLDDILGGVQRGLYVLAGGPGVGKTSFALQVAFHAAEQGYPAVYATFENSSRSLILKALCGRTEHQTPRDVLRGYGNAAELAEAYDEMEEALSRIYVVDGDGTLTLARLRGLARRSVEAHGGPESIPCLVVVDYLQLWAKVSRELRGLADVRARVDTLAGDLLSLARRIDSPVLCLSSQSRAGGRYSGGGSAALDSLKESGDLEYSADVAAFLTAPQDDAQTATEARLLTVAKNRHGPVGEVRLVFRPDTGRFLERSDAF